MAWAKVKAAATYFGVSERTFRSMLNEGFPHSKLPSGTILVELEQGDEYLRKLSANKDHNRRVDEILSGLK